jgi:uncharacterized protein
MACILAVMPDAASLAAAASAAGGKGLPPVHLWNPPFCGDIGMRIAADGTWFYQNSPIGRPAMVRLFSTILRKDPGRHVLVTPVEMVLVEVEDAPFIAVELHAAMEAGGQMLRFRTNVDDWTLASDERPIRFEREASGGLRPYVLVRGGLWAKASRPVYLELVDLAEVETVDGVAMLGVRSGGCFFAMAPASELDDDPLDGDDAE